MKLRFLNGAHTTSKRTLWNTLLRRVVKFTNACTWRLSYTLICPLKTLIHSLDPHVHVTLVKVWNWFVLVKNLHLMCFQSVDQVWKLLTQYPGWYPWNIRTSLFCSKGFVYFVVFYFSSIRSTICTNHPIVLLAIQEILFLPSHHSSYNRKVTIGSPWLYQNAVDCQSWKWI